MEQISMTQDELAAAFTEWELRYRQDPGKEIEDPVEYGDWSAAYLVALLNELRVASSV